MGLVERLRGSMVALDAAPVIYWAEEHPRYLGLLDPVFEAINKAELRAVASTVALVEVLTLPLREGDEDLAQSYRDILTSTPSLAMLSVTPEIAEIAAELRAKHSLKTPDAIHLATARHAGAAFFLTNDDRLPALPGLEVVVLEEVAAQQADVEGDEPSPQV
ncbi:MAG TPA: PIN domain-containing protein [Chloroflexota bacterium]|nr:PIN domain-containing protein [Chloroflexota bacterium]